MRFWRSIARTKLSDKTVTTRHGEWEKKKRLLPDIYPTQSECAQIPTSTTRETQIRGKRACVVAHACNEDTCAVADAADYTDAAAIALR